MSPGRDPDPDATPDEVARLRRQLAEQRRLVDQWQAVAEERGRALRRLQRHPVVRLLLRVWRVVGPFVRRGQWAVGFLRRGAPAVSSLGRALGGLPRRRRGARDLQSAVQARPAPPSRPLVIDVVAIVDPRDEGAQRRVTDLLDQLGDRVGQVRRLEPGNPALTNAVAQATAPAVLLVDGSVEPVHASWLDHLLAALSEQRPVVGAQLVLPATAPLRAGPAPAVVSRGLVFDPAGRRPPRLVASAAGTSPAPELPVTPVAAVPSACVVLDRAAVLDVGGVDLGQDPDGSIARLCWRLHELGRQSVVAPGAVLWHHPPVQHGMAAPEPSMPRALGPAIRRAVDLDRVRGEHVLTARPLAVDVSGSPLDTPRGHDALGRLGWRRVARRASADVRVLARPWDAEVGEGAVLVALAADDPDAWLRSGCLDEADVVLATPALASHLDGRTRQPLHVVEDPDAPDAVLAHLRDLLAERVRRASIVLRIGAESHEMRTWGDTYFAEAFASELRACGHQVWLEPRDRWDSRDADGADVVVHLRGRGHSPRPAGLHVLWVISHPEDLGPRELADVDLVLVASDRLAEDLRARLDVPVHVLLQATDERRFRRRDRDPRFADPVVFLGNSRFTERPLVRAVARAGLPLRVHGSNWEQYLDPRHLGRRFVENDDVPAVYSSADVVLNDHWPAMREWGLVSNRVFDALACEACVVSDPLPELHDLFGDAVATADDDADVAEVVTTLLANPERREEMGRVGRQYVLEGHTFRHRAETFLRVLAETEWPGGPSSSRG